MGEHFSNIGETNDFLGECRIGDLLRLAPAPSDAVNLPTANSPGSSARDGRLCPTPLTSEDRLFIPRSPIPDDLLFLPRSPIPDDRLFLPRSPMPDGRLFPPASRCDGDHSNSSVGSPLIASVDVPYCGAGNEGVAASAPNGSADRFQTQFNPVDPPPAALNPPDKNVPFPGYGQFLQDQRRAIFESEKWRWKGAETVLSVLAGGWAANKFALDFATPIPGYTKQMLRDKAIAHSFGATLSASILGYGIDQLIAPSEMKMEGTVVADCVIAPVISLLPIAWKPKAGLMLGAHELGRFIDHYRQPKQSF